MTFSVLIDDLASRLRAMGWTVDLHADLKRKAYGRTTYTRRLIEIDCSAAEDALAVLAHEAGHALDYRRRRADRRLKAERPDRERRAYLLGWAVLKRVCPGVVSKQTWRGWHADVLPQLGY